MQRTPQQRKIFDTVRKYPSASIRIIPPEGLNHPSKTAVNTIVIDHGLDQYVFTGEPNTTYDYCKRLIRGIVGGISDHKRMVFEIKRKIGLPEYRVKDLIKALGKSEEELISKTRENRKDRLMDCKKIFTVWTLLEQSDITLKSVGERVGGINHATVINRIKHVHNAINGYDDELLALIEVVAADIKATYDNKETMSRSRMREFLETSYPTHVVEDLLLKIEPYFNW